MSGSAVAGAGVAATAGGVGAAVAGVAAAGVCQKATAGGERAWRPRTWHLIFMCIIIQYKNIYFSKYMMMMMMILIYFESATWIKQ